MMAARTCGPDDGQFTCGICMENYTTPRYLPTCGHTFCEHCLFTYARNLQQQGSTKLECPVCRKQHSFPEHNEVTLDWIQTFPLNTVIIKIMESQPKSKKNTAKVQGDSDCVCDACKEQGEIIVGAKYCLDCKETMCERCTNCHKHFKATSGHKLINAKEIPAEAGRTKSFLISLIKCPNHPGREVEFYCKSHEVVICAMCVINSHLKPCDTVEVSSHDADAAGLAEESEKLTSQMRATVDRVSILQKLKTENKNSLKKQLREIRENVQHLKDQVILLMDRIVSHVGTITKQIGIEFEDSIDVEICQVAELKDETEQNVALLDTVEQHGSDRHKFVSAHLMKKKVEEIEDQLCEEEKRLKKIDVELKITEDFKLLIDSTDVKDLVQVTVNKCESTCQQDRQRAISNKQTRHRSIANTSQELLPNGENDIPNPLRDSCTLVRVEEHIVRPNGDHSPSYDGIAIHKDGRVILCDTCYDNGCGYLCLYNPTNKTMMKLKLNRLCSATSIDDTHIAVSIPEDKTICIVSVGNELTVEKTLQAQHSPGSIVALNNGLLAVVWPEPSMFGVIDISGRDIVQRSNFKCNNGLSNQLAVDVDRHHIYFGNRNKTSLFCFDFTGKKVFTSDFRCSVGVALDRCGNLYVSVGKCQDGYSSNCKSSGSIHKLSPSGELISVVTECVPPGPLAICSDIAGTGFWVTQKDDSSVYAHDKIVYLSLRE